jgi:hypothetical protein
MYIYYIHIYIYIWGASEVRVDFAAPTLYVRILLR